MSYKAHIYNRVPSE